MSINNNKHVENTWSLIDNNITGNKLLDLCWLFVRAFNSINYEAPLSV